MTDPTPVVAPDSDVIDLNASRAARREGKAKNVTVRFGEAVLTLPPEFPLDCLSPLREVNLDLGMVVASPNPEQMLRDLVTARPQVAIEAMDAAKAVLEELLCSCEPEDIRDEATYKLLHRQHDVDACGWALFVAERPSGQDIIALGRGLLAAYGLSLGEALTSSDSAGSGGATSKQTSSGTTSSTRVKRGTRPVKAVASASAG